MDPISAERAWRRVRRVTVSANPAANVEASLTVPAGVLWRLMSVQASLVTDATVANRAARLTLTVDNVVVADIPPVAVQAASLTGRYLWWAKDSAYAVGQAQAIPIPDVVMPPGAIIATVTDNRAAGDDWSALTVYAIETQYQRGSIELPDWFGAMVEDVMGAG
jgi:hypothetical protein